MSTPIVTQILDAIEARLNKLSTARGYGVTPQKLLRANLTPWTVGDLPAINLWSGIDERVGAAYGLEQRRLSCFIEYHTLTRDSPFVDVAARLGADITVAINRATSAPLVADNPSTALGGLVSQVTVDSITPQIGEGQAPWCGVLVSLSVYYSCRPEDPFTIQA